MKIAVRDKGTFVGFCLGRRGENPTVGEYCVSPSTLHWSPLLNTAKYSSRTEAGLSLARAHLGDLLLLHFSSSRDESHKLQNMLLGIAEDGDVG